MRKQIRLVYVESRRFKSENVYELCDEKCEHKSGNKIDKTEIEQDKMKTS